MDVNSLINFSIKFTQERASTIYIALFDNYETLFAAGADCWNTALGAKVVVASTLSYKVFSANGSDSAVIDYFNNTATLTFNIAENAADSTLSLNGTSFANLGVSRSDFASGKVMISMVTYNDWTFAKVKVNNVIARDITYRSNVSGFQMANSFVEEGSLLTRPNPPEISGYTFYGWYKDESLVIPFDFTQSIMTDTIVYAKYLDNSKTYYSVILKSVTGKFENVIIPVEGGTALTIPENIYTYNGYDLSWVDETGVTFDQTKPVTENIVVYAKWTEKELELYHKMNEIVDTSYVYEYLQDENGWDKEYTNWQTGDTFVDAEGNEIISKFYGGWQPEDSFITQEDFTRFLLMGQGSITNLKKLDVAKEIVLRYSVNNWDLANGNDPWGSSITFQLFDTLKNALKSEPKDNGVNEGALVSLVRRR